MQVSVAGVLVCCVLLIGGWYLRSPLIVPLLGSLAFGSTAFATLDFLGGASPLIFTVFSLLLIVTASIRTNTFQDLCAVLARHRSSWIVCALPMYALASAVIMPRLFAGQTTIFVPARASGHVFEVPLQPVSGNITQLGYFCLAVLTFLALSALLRSDRHLEGVRRGFFALAAIHASLGTIDLAGKLIGSEDFLSLLRTANYALLTDVSEAGFWRIVGGYSEASAYGGATLVYLAFAYVYWRVTNSRPALLLMLVLCALLVLSTSSTAYAGGTVLAAIVILCTLSSAARGRLLTQDVVMLGLVLLCVTLGLLFYLQNVEQLEAFARLLESAVVNKSLSASAQERMYWNYRSIQSFFDTAGLGIGFGSSRSSSWPIAVVSQIGLAGTLLFAIVIATFFRRFGAANATVSDVKWIALGRAARAAAFATLGAATIAGGGADPGLLFFVCLATVLACRDRLSGEASRIRRLGFSAPAVNAYPAAGPAGHSS
jgi:hypothetical protein